jgi:hypothetical protein
MSISNIVPGVSKISSGSADARSNTWISGKKPPQELIAK